MPTWLAERLSAGRAFAALAGRVVAALAGRLPGAERFPGGTPARVGPALAGRVGCAGRAGAARLGASCLVGAVHCVTPSAGGCRAACIMPRPEQLVVVRMPLGCTVSRRTEPRIS